MAESNKERVVLYSSPGMGHLVAMFELAKLLAAQSFAVTVLTVEPNYNTGSTAPFIAAAASANPSISLHRLPTVAPPPNPSAHREALALDLLRLSNPNLLRFLRSSPPPRALVIDFFCGVALDVAAELRLPCYVHFTSPACFLALFLHMPVLHSKITASFRDLGRTPIEVPGLPTIPADHMPLPVRDREDQAYKDCVDQSGLMRKATGIIINTFVSLETTPIEAISAGRCVPDGESTPPIYCIGPQIMPASGGGESVGREECLSWLDAQPRESVVFLCFGSLGVFSSEQLREIAVGLKRSGQRFLWVVRSPPSEDPAERFAPPAEPDLGALLPEGFVERTRGRGMVVKTWAPQAAVLGHAAVGGFVTHCGWNSVLEAVCGGVPMVAWPLYAEQHVNKVFLVEEARLAAEMRGCSEGVVGAEEVEERVRWLMESEGGKEMRERVAAARKEAEAAVREGGSSHAALMEVVARLKKCR